MLLSYERPPGRSRENVSIIIFGVPIPNFLLIRK